MVFSLIEIMHMLLMSVIAGYIFMDFFRPPSSGDPLIDATKTNKFYQRLKYSIMLVAPAILLHEFGHKFVAIYYGLSATFNAAFGWLLIGAVLKWIRFPVIFFVPAYVQITNASTSQMFFIALAGPVVNLVIGAGAYVYRRFAHVSESADVFLKYTQIINLVLFVFNMIPFPGFDGSKVFSALFSML